MGNMKNLRFRAYYKPENRMIYDIQDEFEERVELGMDCFASYLNNDDFIVEQATWIKDKNGREVYQGDIVAEHNGDIIGTIIQHPSGEWQIAWVEIFGGVSKLYDHRDVCEVIGNIHQNKELLERKNEE